MAVSPCATESAPWLANPTSVTLRFSFSEPFHATQSVLPSAASAGAWDELSGVVNFAVQPVWSPGNRMLKLSLPAPFHPRNSSPACCASAGRASVVSPKVTLFENPVMFGFAGSVPTLTVATLKFSFPEPFQADVEAAATGDERGESVVVSPEMCLRPKLAPLLVETMTFRFSFPEPLNAR